MSLDVENSLMGSDLFIQCDGTGLYSNTTGREAPTTSTTQVNTGSKPTPTTTVNTASKPYKAPTSTTVTNKPIDVASQPTAGGGSTVTDSGSATTRPLPTSAPEQRSTIDTSSGGSIIGGGGGGGMMPEGEASEDVGTRSGGGVKPPSKLPILIGLGVLLLLFATKNKK